MPTDVTQSRRAKKGVRDRMGDGISVGMPTKARMIRNPDTSEYEGTCLVEAVRVVSEADPHRAHRISHSVHFVGPGKAVEGVQWAATRATARVPGMPRSQLLGGATTP